MKYRPYFRTGRRFFQYFRRYSPDPPKTFKDKGMSEENRYFMKKQEEEIKKLREQIMCLECNQKKLEDQLDQTNRAINKICNSKDCEKEE
ncbi:hypothetical protein FF38_12108 [Lucilia cuprina]|uniref:Uncharacterized protein n=1 Tax=Lucilia cuprina TaxID=7375 RepID=A0A0L0BPH6_LUCCU|nr:hypothetical protein CVS40_1932 [Lucilia cuprina]KNC21957.1 hypothetical protein FF38_12108 [Lucilia cuprina]